jgi:hypothetical protein
MTNVAIAAKTRERRTISESFQSLRPARAPVAPKSLQLKRCDGVGSRPSAVRLFSARCPACLLVQAKEVPNAFAAFYDTYAERVLVFFTRRVLGADTAFDLLSETFAGCFDRPVRALALRLREPEALLEHAA